MLTSKRPSPHGYSIFINEWIQINELSSDIQLILCLGFAQLVVNVEKEIVSSET